MDIILYKILTVVIMLCLHNTATALPDLQKALQNLGKNFQSVQTEDTKVRSPQCDTKPTVTEMQLNTFSRASPATNALNSLALSQSLTSQQMGVTSDSLATDADADEEPASPDDSDSTSTTDDSSDGGGGFHPFGRKRRGLLDSLTDTISSIPLFGGSSSSSADDSSSSSDDDSGDDQTRNEKNFESSILQVPNVISQLLPSILKPVGEAVSGVVSSAASILDGVVGGSGESRDGESSCFWASLKCSQNAKYRTMDGSCNNLKHPSWGAANSIHRRFVPNRYHDLISTPRELSAKGGAKLRNVREISTILSQSLGAPSSSASLLLPALGQFLDHDITKTPQPNLTCCAKSQECLSSECFAIQVPPNDAFFTPLGVKCLNFIRSIPGVREDCSLGPREQMNQLSHFIDASQVYGSSRNESENLRNKIKGQLRFRNGQTGTQNDQTTDIRNQFPPTDANCPAGKGGAPANANAINTKVQTCILAGDTRANVQPGLQFMHVLFLRLHNSVAAFIAKNKPKLSDEKIFQEARKIVIGTWQTIVLGEYLPMVLGQPASTDLTQLWSSQYIYNPRLRVGTRNEFTTAAYRFGHAAIRKQVPKNDVSTGKNAGFSDLSENYFSPFQIYGKGLDEIGNGYRQEPAKLVSRQMTDQLQNMLFKPPGQKYGTDLFALNLQRGRDHGIGTYNDLRRFCGLAPASSMSDLSATHAPDSVKALDKAYNGNVEDIDLFAGGVSENFADGSLVGPTFACVIRKQFEILRNGDRYWHESDKEFTSDQQQELHKTKLARLICDFTNNLSVQRDVLQLVTSNNPSIKCSSVADLPVVDYSVFLSSQAVQYQMRELKGDLHPGDVILSNHPVAGGSHLPDLTLITPVFLNNEAGEAPIFFVANRGHHADIGGLTPGSMPSNSTSLDQEGAVFKCFKLVKKGVFQEEAVVEALEAPGKSPGCSGSRNLNDNLSDLKVQIAANQKGIELVGGLIKEYSLEVVQAYMSYIQLQAEDAVRDLIKTVAGHAQKETGSTILYAEDHMDDGSFIKLKISINPKDGQSEWDFTGTSPQVWGNLNASRAVTLSAIIYCLRCMVEYDVPLNQGCLKPVKIIIPKNTLLDPDELAAVVGGNVLTSQRVVDVVLKAFPKCGHHKAA